MESSENAPASSEQGEDVVTCEVPRGGEPARSEEAPQSSVVDDDASASATERAMTGDAVEWRERREEGDESDGGSAPAGEDDRALAAARVRLGPTNTGAISTKNPSERARQWPRTAPAHRVSSGLWTTLAPAHVSVTFVCIVQVWHAAGARCAPTGRVLLWLPHRAASGIAYYTYYIIFCINTYCVLSDPGQRTRPGYRMTQPAHVR